MRKVGRVDIVAIAVLVIIAAFFRFHRLQEVPIGLWRDEAANGLEALHVLDGARTIFFGTREPMFIYLVAVSVAFLGRTPLAIRIVAALVGTATVPVTYFLVRELSASTEERPRVLAGLTSLWLATSYWHINFSRLGFRGALLPLFASLSFYFLWRGWNQLTGVRGGQYSPRWTTHAWFAAAGLGLGLTMYTYTPARFLPLALLPLLFAIVRARRPKPPPAPRRHSDFLSPSAATMALVAFGLSFLLILAPLGVHFLTDTGSFFARSGVSIFSLARHEPLVLVLGKNAMRQLAMFGLAGDPNTRHDPAGRPAFDPLTLIFFLVGIAVSLRRWKDTPYLFSLSWFAVMLLPAMLTYPELPHFLRAIGAVPVAYLFPALGVQEVWKWLRARPDFFRLRYAFAAFVVVCFALIGLLTYRDYFAPVVEEIELVKAFDPRLVDVARLMDRLGEPDSAWIIPLGPNGEQRMAYFVIDFLYQGKAPHRYVRVEETTAAEELAEACQGRKQVVVLNRTEDYLSQPWFDLYADSKGLIPFLLDRAGRRLETLHYDGLELLVYELQEEPHFSMPAQFRPLNIRFNEGLRLAGIACATDPGSPTSASIVLRWRAEDLLRRDYTAQLALVDEHGRTAERMDKLLLSGTGRPTSAWDVSQEEIDYYTFPCLPQEALTQYSIEVSVYDAHAGNAVSAPSRVNSERESPLAGPIPLSTACGDAGHKHNWTIQAAPYIQRGVASPQSYTGREMLD